MAITHSSQIASLPWVGCHAFDMKNFEQCNEYIKQAYQQGNKEEAKLAIYEMGLHGMGIDDEVTDAEMASLVLLFG